MKTEFFNEIKFILGQNAEENWKILDEAKNINENFIWFHLNSFPSGYVIMYATQEELDTSIIGNYIKFGAELCKNNTKYKNLNDLKICYTTLNKIQKTNKIGEISIKGKKKIIKL